MVLARTREAFDHADFLFELKYDGFRALAYRPATATCHETKTLDAARSSIKASCENLSATRAGIFDTDSGPCHNHCQGNPRK